jgi:FHA domain-containing protein
VITLDVHSFNGSTLPQSLSASFDEMGGTIGRADSNQLVLPDPERTISRVHAQVVFRNGSYSIVDRGSNPISINGRPLGSGQESALRAGDEVHIGGYALRVGVSAGRAATAASASSDPFADFGFGAPPPPPPMPVARPPAAASSSVDPLAAFGMAPAPGPAPTASAARAPLAGGIPEDWNPFAPDASAPAPSPLSSSSSGLGMGGFGLESKAAAPTPLIPGMSSGGGSSDSSLDALFGLHAPSGGDPLANSLLDAPAAQPNMAADADPLRSLNSATRASSASAADQLSDLNRPFIAAPVASPPRPLPPPPALVNSGSVSPPPVASAGGSAAVLSWDDPSGQNRTVIRPKAGVPAPGPAPAIVRPIVAEPMPAPVATASAAAPVSGSSDALAQALCEGLGVPTLPGGPLTPATMRLIGELLQEATRGTVELLIARAALKREVRADVTKIVARENNPLKFSPNVDVALNYLLGPATRGFTAPGPAMRDAYDDLRAHQFAFLAGMRAALEGVLKRFDPVVLEGRLTQKSFLATLIPATRKAQMWEVFQQLYSQISTEAADDFHELFGKEFLRAYEAHIDELQKDKP